MSGYKRIPKKIKDEVIAKAEAGAKVVDLGEAYGISTKTIYRWLGETVKVGGVSSMQLNKLKRERDDLLKLVGALTLESSKRKKNKGY